MELNVNFTVEGLNNHLTLSFDKSTKAGETANQWKINGYESIFTLIEVDGIVQTITAKVSSKTSYWTNEEGVVENLKADESYVRVELQEIIQDLLHF